MGDGLDAYYTFIIIRLYLDVLQVRLRLSEVQVGLEGWSLDA